MDQDLALNNKSHKVTYVTCCTDLGRGSIDHFSFNRQFASYEAGLRKNLDTYLPLVCYNSVPDFAKRLGMPNHRNESNYISIPWTKEIVMDKLYDKELFNKKYDDPLVYRDGIVSYIKEYSPLVLMKYYLIDEVMNKNPFNSEYFVWVDCQFTAGMEYDFYSQEGCNKFSEILANRLKHKKFLTYAHSGTNMGTCWRFDYRNFVDSNIIMEPFALHRCMFGFFWGGHRDILKEMYEPYWNLYRKFLNHNVIPTEEVIVTVLNIIQKDKFDYNFINDIGMSSYKQQIFNNVFNSGF